MLVGIFTSHTAETDETGKKGNDFMTGKVRDADNLIEGLLLLQDLKQ
jgi:hypothetical protein